MAVRTAATTAIAQWSAHTNRFKGSSQRSFFRPGYLSKYLHTSRPRYKCRYEKQVNSCRPFDFGRLRYFVNSQIARHWSHPFVNYPASLIYGPGQDLRSRRSRRSPPKQREKIRFLEEDLFSWLLFRLKAQGWNIYSKITCITSK